MPSTAAKHTANRTMPKELKGLIGRSTAAVGYPITARSDVQKMLSEGWAADADAKRARLIVYHADGDRVAAQLIIKPGKGWAGRKASSRFASVESTSAIDAIVQAWWPELGFSRANKGAKAVAL